MAKRQKLHASFSAVDLPRDIQKYIFRDFFSHCDACKEVIPMDTKFVDWAGLRVCSTTCFFEHWNEGTPVWEKMNEIYPMTSVNTHVTD